MWPHASRRVHRNSWGAGLQALAFVVGVASCSRDATSPQNVSCADNTTSVNVTISAGGSVAFDWTPACPLSLFVVETSNGHDQWWIAGFNPDSIDNPAVGANRIVPRVTYGQVPATATNSLGPEPLVAGTTYTVALWRALPIGSPLHCQQNHGTACLLAVTTFTR
jgi:hypothetical protein